ncbi:RNA polymerase sigma factor [Corallococcus sp. M34]|uniref:RNA polymerase sigma factor n=1 Tax=Citreicoccus inhibens TaxID=2849499 RepID=UPI00131503DE|nr:RNA polymerase sigma factor [Citreicoccus inhibens]MBU8899394.1 RNA polymerase sigma factor [Citreicoccus inhibens]
MDTFALEWMGRLPAVRGSRRLTAPEPTSQPVSRVESEPPSLEVQDRRWFDAFIRQHDTLLRTRGMQLAGNASDVGDLIQDTYERAWRHREQLKTQGDARAWLLRVQRNLFFDRHRLKLRERRAGVSAEEVQETVAAPLPEDEPLWAKFGTAEVREALEQIPEEFRTVFRMKEIEGRSYIEIADHLGLNKNTVGTRLARARQKLHALLTPQPPETE